jgi:hypothetical protein
MDGDRGSEDARRLAIEAATVVDPLLADVWTMAWQIEHGEADDPWAALAVLLRMAYLQGYGDALREEHRGEVFDRLGVNVPDIKVPRQRAGRSRRSQANGDSSGR